MSKYRYELVDVFTDVAFGGNPLAVFADARGIPPELMPRLARELNLSETTFVLPPVTAGADCRVRIFTPGRELAFAGHPTLGTAFVRHRLAGGTTAVRYVFEEGVGPITVTVGPAADGSTFVEMEQPAPHLGAVREGRAALAAALGLAAADLALDTAPAQLVSSGTPFLLVPLTGRDAARRASARADLLATLLGDEALGILVWTTEVDRAGSHVHARMFAPGAGVPEDPATGSAIGPLAAYLLAHGVVSAERAARLVVEQGVEMGRPSILVASAATTGGPVRVGGACVLMGHGELDVP